MTPLADGIHALMKISSTEYARNVFLMQSQKVQAEILKATKCPSLESLLEKME